MNFPKMASATKAVQVFRNFLMGVRKNKLFEIIAVQRYTLNYILYFFWQKKLKVPLRYPGDQAARYEIQTLDKLNI